MEGNTPVEISTNPYTLFSFIFYISLMLVIGVISARFSSRGLTEFFLGGRQMHRFVVALSAVVSGRSSWLFIGVTGMAYMQGVSAVWAVAGYTIVELLMFIFAAPRLRQKTEAYDSLTIPDYFEARFNDKSHLLRILAVFIILIFMVAYISAQFVGGGKAFSASFHISPFVGIVFTAAIVLLYTILGGFLAVSLTDVLQGIFMIFALAILPVIAILDFGGLSRVLQDLAGQNSALVDPFALGTGALLGFLGIGFGSPGNPHILVRYMSIRDYSHLKYSALIGTFWNVVMGWSAVFIGLAGRAYFNDPSLLPNADAENIFPHLAQLHLHPVIFGIIIAAILAAIMSTADSMLLVCASAVIRDIYQKVYSPAPGNP